MPGLFHPDAEIGVARAAEATGPLYCLSTMARCSIEEVAARTAAPKLFQPYIFRDRGVTRDLLMRAQAAGSACLVLAIDVPVPAHRKRARPTRSEPRRAGKECASTCRSRGTPYN